jgi:uncharacterized SAM-binding protein YcdF (DUF218 family)
MAILESAGNGSWSKDNRAHPSRGRWSAALTVLRYLSVAAAVGLVAVLVGFAVFLHALERTDASRIRKADAIVVLTGGAERITDAVDLLRNGSGERLLISGVANDVTGERLAQKAPAVRSFVRCCIDLGHAARNTVGNAKEARHWAVRQGYRSLIVVTSSYHMPRALVEFRRQLPGIDLVAAPVVTDKLKVMDFWSHPELLRTIGVEYAKFVVAYARACLTPARPMDEISATTTRRRV